MTRTQQWSELLAGQVVSLVESTPYMFAEDYEPLVEEWLQDINPEVRPSVSAVMMQSKRKLYNLAPLPF